MFPREITFRTAAQPSACCEWTDLSKKRNYPGFASYLTSLGEEKHIKCTITFAQALFYASFGPQISLLIQ